MKKFSFYFSAIIAVAITISLMSCQKDGVYNPGKQIYRTFYQGSSGGKALTSTWTWDKKKLAKIEYSSITSRFEYDGKKLSKVIYSDGSYLKYSYNGSKFEKIEMYEDNTLAGALKISHDKNKISQIVAESYDEAKMLKFLETKPEALSFTLQDETIEGLKNFTEKKKNTKATVEYTINYTWDGSNVSKVVQEYVTSGSVYTRTYEYTYDKKKNPYKGFLDEEINVSALSASNITKAVVSTSDNTYYEVETSYSYDGNYPTESTSITRYGSTSSTSTRYIEYN